MITNYNNPRLSSETCAAGQLRRYECAWQNQVDWMRSLRSSEVKLLQSADLSDSDATATPEASGRSERFSKLSQIQPSKVTPPILF